VVLNHGAIEPQGFGESVSAARYLCSLSTVIVCVDGTWYSFCTNTVYSNTHKLWIKKKKRIFDFSNYEGFGECMYGTCGV